MTPDQLQLEAKLFKGFGDKSRLSILEELSESPKTVTELVKKTKLSQPNTSMHLACLVECGLVQKEKNGREVKYSLAMEEVGEMMKQARAILKRHSKEIYECTTYED